MRRAITGEMARATSDNFQLLAQWHSTHEGGRVRYPRQGRGTVNMNKSSDPFAAACASSRYPARPTNRLANAVTPEDKEEDEAHQALDESMHHLAHLHRHCVLPHS